MITATVAYPSSDTERPDDRCDVIVHHVTPADRAGMVFHRWTVFAGEEKRVELDDAPRALVFAHLLAQLRQGRVWIRHDESDPQPVDSSSIRGCSCC
jgi:hypothetical protein